MDGILGFARKHPIAAAAGAAAVYAAWQAYKKLRIEGEVVETERHGGELVAQVLKAHGVKFLFTLVGGHISPILVAAKATGIRVVDVRHEVTAVFAADAVARLTGVPGVAAVTAGPGVTNTVTAVKNAQMAESPLVLIGGAAATLLRGKGSLQDIDQMSVLKPICKWVATCDRVADIVPTMRRAFQEAVSGVPGPVFVELPIDILYPIAELRANMGLCTRIRRRELSKAEDIKQLILPVESADKGVDAYLASRRPDQPVFVDRVPRKLDFIVERFLRYKLNYLFGGGFDREHDVTPLPVSIPMPQSGDLSAATELLRRAERPVLIVGSQATLLAHEVDRLAAAITDMGVPTFLSGMARGLLGRNSRYHVRQNRRQALREADVVIMAGTVADFRLDYGRTLSKKSKIVTINRSAEQIWKNATFPGAFWKPDVPAVSDPCHFLLDLAERVGPGRGRFDAWAEKLKASEITKEKANARKAAEPAIGRDGTRLVNPLHLVHEVEDILPDDSILIGDGGDFVATASYVVRPRGPLRWLDPGVFGTLGVGGGFALGAKLARPSAEVWLIWGDGSVGYSVAEFDTFKRHNVPIIALVGNDACWTQIEREQIPIFDDDVACPLEYTPYEEVAAGYGGGGAVIASHEEDIRGKLKRAQRAAAGERGVPYLVNVKIGSTNFREGSLSV